MKKECAGGIIIMYELLKSGTDIIFYAVAAVAIIGAVIKIVKSKKDKDKDDRGSN